LNWVVLGDSPEEVELLLNIVNWVVEELEIRWRLNRLVLILWLGLVLEELFYGVLLEESLLGKLAGICDRVTL